MNEIIYLVAMEFHQKPENKINRHISVQTIHIQPYQKVLNCRDGIISILNNIRLKLSSWHLSLK
jgi:hypothetical protein